MTIETSLHEEILNGFDDLNRMERGTETHKTTVDELAKLLDRAIEIERIESESKDRDKARKIEESLKRAQMEEEAKDRRVKNGIAIGGIVLPLVVTVWGTFKTFRFEETGTVTTMMGRGFINKLIPKK